MRSRTTTGGMWLPWMSWTYLRIFFLQYVLLLLGQIRQGNQDPENERDKTPESLGSPESIVLEEPPKKKQQLEELLQDLACTPSISLSSVSLSEEESDTDIEIDPSKNQDKHNKKEAKKVDDDKPKQRKTVTDQTKKIV